MKPAQATIPVRDAARRAIRVSVNTSDADGSCARAGIAAFSQGVS